MPIKEHLYRFQPLQLYIILVLSICYFSVQLVLSHLTHALTLLMASHHMLCNIIALTGCILTIKHSKRMQNNFTCGNDVLISSFPQKQQNQQQEKQQQNDKQTSIISSTSPTIISTTEIENEKNAINNDEKSLAKIKRREMKLRNTFGWTRIDVLTMLIVCIILSSLSFSLLVEALQTLIHIDHQDTMHMPIPVMILGCIGLILNGLCYLLIGGYTMHQGSFLHVTPAGDVILDNSTLTKNGDITLKPDNRQLSKTRNYNQQESIYHSEIKEFEKNENEIIKNQSKRQGILEMFRDISSTIFVIICTIIVYLANDDEYTSKYIDPILSIFSCILLLILSYPYMKESCLILLQTIPDSIDMEIFERSLVMRFPEIISYHDLHIWQLSANKYVSTVHIKFQNPKLYYKVIDEVRSFFFDQGITIVTIQPEFQNPSSITDSLQCLVQCHAKDCIEKVCCRDSRSDLEEINIINEHKDNNDNCKIDSNSKLKELKISSLLKLDKIMSRSQSVNNVSNGNDNIGSYNCISTNNAIHNNNSSSCSKSKNKENGSDTLIYGKIKKISSDLNVQMISTKEIPILKSSSVTLTSIEMNNG